MVFIPTYYSNFDAAIDLAKAAANDEYVVDLQVKETNDVNVVF